MNSNGFKKKAGDTGDTRQAQRSSIAAIIVADGDEVLIQELRHSDDGKHKKKESPFHLVADFRSPNRIAQILPGKKQGDSFFSRPVQGSISDTPFYRIERVTKPSSQTIHVTATSLFLNRQR